MIQEVEKTKKNDDDELVTKGYLREAFVDFKHEVKTEIKMELKSEFDDIRMMISRLAEEQKNMYKLIAGISNRLDQQFAVILKYIDGNEADKQKTNQRLDVLESKVLLA